MKLILDRYANLDSPIHRWQQNYKLVALFSLILAFAFVQDLILLPVIIIITTIIFVLSRLPLSFLLSRLRYPGWFILAIVILLPILAGNTIIFSLGLLTIKKEGLITAIIVSVRFFCILTLSIVLFGTAPFFNSIKAMQNLGIPQLIVDMTLLAYRYLEELGEMLATMQRAIKLRGFRPKKFSVRNLKIIAQLTGSLLVRSYDQSQRIYQAMLLRGYGQQTRIKKRKKYKSKTDKYSLSITIVTIIISCSLFGAEIILSGK